MAQLAEHVIGNDEVPGPNPGSSSKKSKSLGTWIFLSKPIGLVYHQPVRAVYHQLDRAVYHQPVRAVYHQLDRAVYHQPDRAVYHLPDRAVYHLPAKAVYIAALARRISSKKRVPKHPPFYLWISILCVNNL